MIRVFCKNQTFLLTALDGSSMVTKPNGFNEIDEKFTIDPTYKMAVKAGALEVFKTTKQGDKIADNAAKGNQAGEAKPPEGGKESDDAK